MTEIKTSSKKLSFPKNQFLGRLQSPGNFISKITQNRDKKYPILNLFLILLGSVFINPSGLLRKIVVKSCIAGFQAHLGCEEKNQFDVIVLLLLKKPPDGLILLDHFRGLGVCFIFLN